MARIVDAVDAHVDHHRAGLYPVAFNHLGPSHGGDQHIRRAHHARQVFGARVAHRHRGVAADQQQGGRHAHNVRAAQHHRVGAVQLHAQLFQHHHTAQRRARHKQRIAALLRQAAHIDRVKAVYVLFQANRAQHGFFV